jgi:hypothetical protein
MGTLALRSGHYILSHNICLYLHVYACVKHECWQASRPYMSLLSLNGRQPLKERLVSAEATP